MDVAQVIDLGKEALWVAVLVSAPLLGVALAIGLIVGIFQAATSINEMTLAFVPKVVLVFMAFGLLLTFEDLAELTLASLLFSIISST